MREETKEFWKLVYGETRFQKSCAILSVLSLAFVFSMIITNIYELATG
jgi:hypothetical protein